MMFLGSSSHLVSLACQLESLSQSPSHQDTQVVCRDGSRTLSRLLLGLAFPSLASCPRFCSDLQLVLLLPHHSLAEVESSSGLGAAKEQDCSTEEDEDSTPADHVDDTAEHDASKEPEAEGKKPRKLKQFTLQQQMDILDELRLSGGNKSAMAQKYSISRSSLQYWERREAAIRDTIGRGQGASYKVTKGLQRPAHPRLEKELEQWVRERGQGGGRMTPRQIARQALLLHGQGRQGKKFTASQTWVEKFLRRSGLTDSPLIAFNAEADAEDEGSRFACHQCGKQLSSVHALKVHSTIHLGERPHVCTYCAKDFRGKKELEYHERTHTGEKPYSCKICGKASVDASNMKKHEKVHTSLELDAVSNEEEGTGRRSKFYTKSDNY